MKGLTQYYFYRAHKKREVLFYVLYVLRYLPEHHLCHKKAMFLTKGDLLLTSEPLLVF